MKFDITLKKADISAARKKIVLDSSKEIQLKGFRKGKAPIDLVEKQLDESKVQQQILNQLVPDQYIEYINSNKLHPLGQPEISPKSIKNGDDWVLQVEIAQAPSVKLGNYQSAIKKINLPKKSPKSKKATDDDSEILSKIFDVLLETCQVEVPELLVKQESDQKLSQLIQQLEQLNLNLEKYAASTNKSVEDIQSEYKETANNRLKLEFILDEIKNTQKITASDTDVKHYITTIKNESTKKQISNDPQARKTIRYSLERDKVIDYLKSLISKKK